ERLWEAKMAKDSVGNLRAQRSHSKSFVFGYLMLAAVAFAFPATAQQLGTVQQPLVNFDPVDNATVSELGLVSIQSKAGLCSGALLNDSWAPTAHHCVIGAPAATTNVTPADANPRAVTKIVDLVSMGQLDLALLQVATAIPHRSPVSLPQITA